MLTRNEHRKVNVIPRLDRGISWNMAETQEIPACAGMTGRKVMSFNAIVLTVALFVCHTASANILSISTKVELTVDAPTKVTLQYQVDSLPSSIDFRIIRFDQIDIYELTFSANNKQLEHTLDAAAFPVMSGALSLPDPGSIRSITISYLVHSAEGENKVIPIALLGLKPPIAANGVFKAAITYPDEFELQQSFPSQSWMETALQSSFDMQVIPSVIKATLVRSGSGGISSTMLIDIFVLICLLGLSYLGWQRLKNQNS